MIRPESQAADPGLLLHQTRGHCTSSSSAHHTSHFLYDTTRSLGPLGPRLCSNLTSLHSARVTSQCIVNWMPATPIICVWTRFAVPDRGGQEQQIILQYLFLYFPRHLYFPRLHVSCSALCVCPAAAPMQVEAFFRLTRRRNLLFLSLSEKPRSFQHQPSAATPIISRGW